MTEEGQIVLFHFPQTNLAIVKLRPALVLRELPGKYDDWLICMISSRLKQGIVDFDELIDSTDSDFKESGLKVPSLVRISRLAVVNSDIFIGKLGKIDNLRLLNIRKKLSAWLLTGK